MNFAPTLTTTPNKVSDQLVNALANFFRKNHHIHGVDRDGQDDRIGKINAARKAKELTISISKASTHLIKKRNKRFIQHFLVQNQHPKITLQI